jgi:hypothetical protein
MEAIRPGLSHFTLILRGGKKARIGAFPVIQTRMWRMMDSRSRQGYQGLY